jgi:hypothetical protein
MFNDQVKQRRDIGSDFSWLFPSCEFYATPEQDGEQDARIGQFREFIRASVSPAERALELGPSYNPLVPKRLGFNVTIVDHASAEDLKRKYSRDPVDVSLIEPVDVIWSGGKLSEDIRERDFSAIVASHMIEHATDFIGFLQDCSELLAMDKELFLIVPDKRFGFDCLHSVTDTAKVIADHRLRRKKHSLEALFRNSSNVRAQFGETVSAFWGQHEIADLRFVEDDPKASLAGAIKWVDAEDFFDCHENYFTPSSFFLLIEELRYLGFTDFAPRIMTRSRGCEFLAILRRAASSPTRKEHMEVKKFLYLNMLREEREWLSSLGGLLDRTRP